MAKRKKPDWVAINLSLSPSVVTRLRVFCGKRGYLLRPVVEYALVRFLDDPPAEVPTPERRGRPPREGKPK